MGAVRDEEGLRQPQRLLQLGFVGHHPESVAAGLCPTTSFSRKTPELVPLSRVRVRGCPKARAQAPGSSARARADRGSGPGIAWSQGRSKTRRPYGGSQSAAGKEALETGRSEAELVREALRVYYDLE